MTQEREIAAGTWLTATSKVLYERPERLQQLVMEIAEKNPEIGCYASDLARLRMSGLLLESLLFKLWNADSVDYVDQVMQEQWQHPCAGVVHVLANLIKNDMNRGYRLATVH